jgi:hypothetical protein
MKVTITDDEAATVGVTVGTPVGEWHSKIKPLLVAKGVPEDRMYLGAPCRMLRDNEAGLTIFEFPPYDDTPATA